jgi:hypothetical protein
MCQLTAGSRVTRFGMRLMAHLNRNVRSPMLRSIHAVIVFVMVSALALHGCIPTSTAVISFQGGSVDLSVITRIEDTIENIGFHRTWFEPKDQPSSPRLHRDGAVLSWFESNSPGYMVRVVRVEEDGSTKIFFTEFNTSFSASGKALYARLANQLSTELKIIVVRDESLESGESFENGPNPSLQPTASGGG